MNQIGHLLHYYENENGVVAPKAKPDQHVHWTEEETQALVLIKEEFPEITPVEWKKKIKQIVPTFDRHRGTLSKKWKCVQNKLKEIKMPLVNKDTVVSLCEEFGTSWVSYPLGKHVGGEKMRETVITNLKVVLRGQRRATPQDRFLLVLMKLNDERGDECISKEDWFSTMTEETGMPLIAIKILFGNVVRYLRDSDRMLECESSYKINRDTFWFHYR